MNRRWLLLSAALVSALSLYLLNNSTPLLQLDLRSRVQALLLLIHGHIERPEVTLAFVAAHSVAVALCFPGAMLFELFAGFAFGVWRAIAFVLLAKLAGGVAGFALGRTVFRAWAQRVVASNAKWAALFASIGDNGFQFSLLLRLSPLPSYVGTYGLSLTPIRTADFLAATVVGSVPFIANNVLLGSMARSIEATVSGDIELDEQPDAIFTLARVRGLFVVVGGVAVLLLVRKMSQLISAAAASAIDSQKAATGAAGAAATNATRRRRRVTAKS